MNNHLDILHWNEKSFTAAIKSNCLNIVKFLRSKRQSYTIDRQICNDAIMPENITVLIWIRSNSSDFSPFAEKIYTYAINIENLKLSNGL